MINNKFSLAASLQTSPRLLCVRSSGKFRSFEAHVNIIVQSLRHSETCSHHESRLELARPFGTSWFRFRHFPERVRSTKGTRQQGRNLLCQFPAQCRGEKDSGTFFFNSDFRILTDYFRASGRVITTFNDRMETTSPEMEAAAVATINRATRTRVSAPKVDRYDFEISANRYKVEEDFNFKILVLWTRWSTRSPTQVLNIGRMKNNLVVKRFCYTGVKFLSLFLLDTFTHFPQSFIYHSIL